MLRDAVRFAEEVDDLLVVEVGNAQGEEDGSARDVGRTPWREGRGLRHAGTVRGTVGSIARRSVAVVGMSGQNSTRRTVVFVSCVPRQTTEEHEPVPRLRFYVKQGYLEANIHRIPLRGASGFQVGRRATYNVNEVGTPKALL